MLYTSVADIYGELAETRRRLVARVESLAAARQTERAAEGAWTVAEIVEHLSMTEGRLLGMMKMLLAGAEKAAAAQTSDDAARPQPNSSAFRPFSLDEYAERARGQRLEAPEMIRPTGGVPVADSLARLAESRRELEALRPRFERAGDLSSVTYPHPAFGPLDPYQWLAFVGLHEARHLAQIERLLGGGGTN